MRWLISHRFDTDACQLADRHYTRQTIGAPQFVPPGRCIVLLGELAAKLDLFTGGCATKIGDHALQYGDRVGYSAHHHVASGAGQSSDTTSKVVMVYAKASTAATQNSGFWLAADGANAVLAKQHSVVLRESHAVLSELGSGAISWFFRNWTLFPSIQRYASPAFPADSSSASNVRGEIGQRFYDVAFPTALIGAQRGKLFSSSTSATSAFLLSVFPSPSLGALDACGLQAICAIWRSMETRCRNFCLACWAVLAAVDNCHRSSLRRRRARFQHGRLIKGGLLAFQMLPAEMPEPMQPRLELPECA